MLNIMIYRAGITVQLICVLWIVHTGHCERVEFCKSQDIQLITKQLGQTVQITSPQYPADSYSISKECKIIVAIEQPSPTTPLMFAVYIDQPMMNADSECSADYQIQDNNSRALPKWENCTTKEGVKTLNIHVLIKDNDFGLKLPAGNRTGFRLNLSVLPLRSLGKSTSPSVNATQNPTAYIMSHEQFNFHDTSNNTQFYGLKLVDIPATSTKVILDFIYFNIGANYLRVSNADNATTLLYANNTELQGRQISIDVSGPTKPTLALVFDSKTGLYRGFLVRYSVRTSVPTTLPTLVMTRTSTAISTSVTTGSSSGQAHNAITTSESERSTSATISPSPIQQFFSVHENIIAVVVGAVALILIIVVVVCVLRRRPSRSRKQSSDAVQAACARNEQAESTHNYIQLTEDGKTHPDPPDLYSSIEPAASARPGAYGAETTHDTLPAGEPEVEYASINPATRKKPVIMMENVPDVTETVEEEYASINPATRKKPVIMMENELYGSRDSLSSQSSND